jgi:hypothetical protein
MTIIKLLQGEKVNFLQVNVLKEINSTQFIVGDHTGMAIMTTDCNAAKCFEVGKGLKMVKPSKIEDNVITSHPKFNPMKTKALQLDFDYDKINELEAMGDKAIPVNKGTTFSQIEKDFGDNAVIDQVLAYVTSASRIIEGKYGSYQICNLVDCDSNSLAINCTKRTSISWKSTKSTSWKKSRKPTSKPITNFAWLPLH